MQAQKTQIVDQFDLIGHKLGHTTFVSDWQGILDQPARELIKQASWEIKFNTKWVPIFIEMIETGCKELQITPYQNEDAKIFPKCLPIMIAHIGFPNLILLSLRDLNILSIESLAFLNIEHVKELDLANNKITSIKSFNKQKWKDLNTLNLHRNKMRQVDINRTKLRQKIWFLNYDYYNHDNFYRIKNEIQVEDISKVVKLQSQKLKRFILSQVNTYLKQPQICKKIKDKFPGIDLLTQNEFMMWT